MNYLKLTTILITTAVLAGCGGNSNSNDEKVINITGSSTVAPIMANLAEEYSLQSDAVVNVDGPGTGDGFAAFCNGEADITGASRKVKEEEAAICSENGISYEEILIAYDGLSLITNSSSELQCLNMIDIYSILGEKSQGKDSWEAIEEQARILGSETKLPKGGITIVGPGEESGTYDSLIELALQKVDEDAEATRPDYQSSSDDNIIVQSVSGAENSIGWVGFAYAELTDDIKEVSVDGGNGCIQPSIESIKNSTYPLTRPLYVYAKTGTDATFMSFLNKNVGRSADAVGYVSL